MRREPHGDPGAGGAGVGEPDSQPLLARASEVRREPHGDPGAGGAGVGEPDSQPLLARESKLPCAPLAARGGEFRLVVTDCERGCPLSHFPPKSPAANLRFAAICFLAQSAVRRPCREAPASTLTAPRSAGLPPGITSLPRRAVRSPAGIALCELRAGNRNSLARLRRAAASSDWSLLIVKGGNPLSHFPARRSSDPRTGP